MLFPERDRLVARCTFPRPGTHVDCAVSGGADSLALLVLAVHAGCSVTAWHVDHGLRPNNTDADVVRDAAATYGARFELRRVDVPDGPNLEARAREARRRALPADVLTGHTADDQAETVLLALLRGAGVDGLSGMAPEGHPLLGLRRVETQALCESEGLFPVLDPSNHDARFRRNRVRHELLPLANDIAQRDVVPLIVRTAELMRSQQAELAGTDLDPTDAVALTAADENQAKRALREWLKVDGYPPNAHAVERVLAVARGERVATEVARVGRVRRSKQRLSKQP